MISLFVYLRSPLGAEQAINALAAALNIDEPYRFQYGDAAETDYSFFNEEKNSLFYELVEGDFLCSVDLNIFASNDTVVKEKMLELSRTGLEIAIPVEDEDRPFSYQLLSAGLRQNIEIVEDGNELKVSG